MSRYVLIEAGRVVAAIEWDGKTPVAGALVASTSAGIGDGYSGGVFTPAPEPPRIKSELETLVDALVTKGVITREDVRPAAAQANAHGKDAR